MSKQKIQPLGNRLVVQRQEAQTTKGGIILPDAAKEKPRQGKVVAVGPGKVDEKGRKVPVDVKVGDEVLFSSYSGTEYKAGDVDYLILSEDDVLAVFN
jgi:chaperonin GroES